MAEKAHWLIAQPSWNPCALWFHSGELVHPIFSASSDSEDSEGGIKSKHNLKELKWKWNSLGQVSRWTEPVYNFSND